MRNKDKIKSDDLVFPPFKSPAPISAQALKEYEVIQSICLEHLKDEIKSYLRSGWEVAGGATYCPKMGIWYQTIVYK